MSSQKRLFLLLITILITIGVCGCMSVEQDYKEPIRDYLEKKYDCGFTVHSATEAFSGSDGQYIYAQCESVEYPGEMFDVYCYCVDEEKNGEVISLNGEDYNIYEKYAEVSFADEMKRAVEQLLPEDVFVGCKIRFDCGYALHYCVTEEQFKQGLEACLNNKEFYSFVTLYIVAGDNADITLLQETVEGYCSKYNAHEQYVYFATSPNMDKAVVEDHFNENSAKFGRHLLDCNLIQEVRCTEMNRDKGIVEQTIEKR